VDFPQGTLPVYAGVFSSKREYIMFVRFFSGQKNTWFSKAVEAAFVLVVAALVFTGCPQPTGSGGGSIQEALEGEWISTYLENYQISNTEFSSLTSGGGYKGDIVNIISDSGNAGYIIIRYTLNTSYSDAIGNYYAVYYENLTASTVKFSGAYSSGDTSDGAGGAKGKASQEAAESTYTKANGYFGVSSDCYKAGFGKFQSPIIGTWSDEDSSSATFLITEKTIGYSYTWSTTLIGNIVKVRDLEDGSGYITFKYTYAPLNDGLIGQYCVLYWKDINAVAGTAKISIASSNGNPGDEGKPTIQKAETEYTIEDADNYYDPLSCAKQ
jgi:hypothetical protein